MQFHSISAGETLSSIAKQYGVSVKQLQQLNGIKNANLIFAGTTIKIPDVSEEGGFDIPGMVVEKNAEEKQDRGPIYKTGSKVVPMYGVICPGGEEPGISKIIPKPGDGKIVPMYGITCPGGDEPGISKIIPKPGDGKIVPMYGITCPGGDEPGIGGEKPVLPGAGDPWWKGPISVIPLYGVVCPGDPGKEKDPGVEIDPKPVEGEDPKPGEGKTPGTDEGEKPVEGNDNFKITAKAVDVELLKRRGASFDVNDPNARAQFVVGDEAGEVSTSGGTVEQPETITIKDNTNGNSNTYVYQKVSPEEIAAGKTKNGVTITKDQFKDGESYYILIEAKDSDGNNLRRSNHAEVYKLDLDIDAKAGTVNYDLIQEKGLDGSDQSSMYYNKRKN